MRIIIAGDGKVGNTLASQLSRENHDVVVIDKSQRVIDDTVNTLDVMGVCGNCASYSVQQEADVAHADLVIATTESDELNMLCCLVAKKAGAKHTIARVRNPEYSDQLLFMREELGLSMFINPEYSAARELFQMLRFPSAMKIETFSNRRVELVEIKLHEDSPLAGVVLHELNRRFNVRVLVCAVRRGDDVLIPTGNFVLQEGDKISLSASPSEIERLFRSLKLLRREARSVMIVGGGHIAHYLARMLIDIGVSVRIVERNQARCEQLSELLPKAMIIHGDGTEQELLLEEGIASVDAFVSLTGYDEENIILSMYASSRGVGKVITKVNRAPLASLVEGVGLESIISPKDLSVNSILRYVRAMQNSEGSNVETLYKIVGGRVEALEFRADVTAPLLGIPLKELQLRPNLLIASIARDKRTILPGGDDVILANDRVIVVTTNEQLRDLKDILA